MNKQLKKAVALTIAAVALAASVFYIMPHRPAKGVFQVTGIVQATEVNLAPRISERIKEIKFHEGDYAKAGETAIILDDRKQAAELDQAQANLEVEQAAVVSAAAAIEKAKVKIKDTKRDLERNSRLLEKNLIAQNDVDKAQTACDMAVADLNGAQAQKSLAEASVKQAQAALKVAGTNLEDTVVHPTLSGVVTLRAFEPGEMVSAGSTVLTVVDLSDIWVRVDVEETVVSRIKLGDAVSIKIDSLPGQEFGGHVSEINSEGEFATQRDVKRGRQDIKTYRVKVKLDEPKGMLKEGMTATVGFGE